MSRWNLSPFLVALCLCSCLVACQKEKAEEAKPAAEGAETLDAAKSEAKAIEIADQVMEAMGGRAAWERTRYVSWKFFGVRRHFWDRATDDVRIEKEDLVILMNLKSREGRVQKAGQEITDLDAIHSYMEQGFAWWTNDAYWMFMPYKLRDPGVVLKFKGEKTLEDARVGDVLDMTFVDDTGLTPRNRYELFINRETGLVESWTFFTDRDDPTPKFTLPWTGWTRFGEIMLATGHGQGHDWEIRVHDTLPASVFKVFEDVVL